MFYSPTTGSSYRSFIRRPLALFALAAFLLPLIISFTGVQTCAAGDKPKVVMVLVNRITLEDITGSRYANINKLIKQGGLGLMTVNSGGDYSDVNSYVSLGGGDKFVGSGLAGRSFNREEILGDGANTVETYERNTGKSSGKYQILNVSIAATLKVNQKRFTVSTPGQLGNVLHQAGLTTAVIGNADLSETDEPNRLAANIAMDDLGRVDYGDVSRDLLVKDKDAPFGWRTDYQRLQTKLDKVWNNSDFIVIETGDTIRANQSSDLEMKQMVEYHRDRALKGVDGIIGTLLNRADQDTLILMVTPLPNAQALRDGVRLTPVIAAGGRIEPGSVLTSSSTRQKGLTVNFDLTATVADFLMAKPSEGIIGLPVKSLQENNQPAYISGLFKWLVANTRQRVGVLFYFTRYQWIVYTLVLLTTFFRYYRQVRWLRLLLAGILVYPLAILLLPLTGSVNPWLTISLSLVVVALLAYLITRFKNDLTALAVAAFVNVVPSVIDVLTGGNLMKRAALSYDLVVGGRYYGIGNEYMGVVIGGTILGTAALLQLLPKYRKQLFVAVILTFAALIVFFAAPTAGSKAGGAITAMTGFGVTLYLYSGRKFKLRTVFIVLLAVAAGVTALAVINSLFSASQQSHIGRAFSNLFQGNFLVIWQMALRKLMANLYLLQHSPFAVILILQLAVLLGLYLRERKYWQGLLVQMPFVKAGAIGMLVGALAAIALNDSGVIGAPLLLNYLVVPVTYIVLGKQPEHGKITSDRGKNYLGTGHAP